MRVATGARRGRPATASRDDVLRAAREQYLGGQRVDLTILARRLGLGRATIYRWFGSRERVLGEVIAAELESLLARKRREVRQRGMPGLLEVFDRTNRALAGSSALRQFLDQERAGAMRLLTSSTGVVRPTAVACVTGLITAEAAAGRYTPTADPETLAYAIVRLAEAFLYSDAAIGIRGDHTRLREVQAALLGAPLVDRRSVSDARGRRLGRAPCSS
ncbi:MAG: QsdR family transcriptional regulator [Solirubrobacteraceae bacterium]